MQRNLLLVSLLLLAGVMAGCSAIPSAGPNSSEIVEQKEVVSPIPVLDLNESVTQRLLAAERRLKFSEVFTVSANPGYRIGPGDSLEVTVWEAPPAALFGGSIGIDARQGTQTTRAMTLPEQMVSHDGTINVPFAGAISAAGKTLPEVEAEVARRLQGKANQPQILVRMTKNVTSNVTVVGEVQNNVLMPLTAKGERILDAVATAGGVKQPVGKITLQLTREQKVHAMPLDSVIQDPVQNINLRPGDVLTALFQPLSFTALGATSSNQEIPFEAQGISLTQALGRLGGLQDQRADPKGVFIFRFEDPALLGDAAVGAPTTPDGKVPVIYRVDLRDPRTFFVAQAFPVRNKDVLYVANAPVIEFQKFLNILVSSAFLVRNTLLIGQ
jgi:polysaccharide export outer membrane protein